MLRVLKCLFLCSLVVSLIVTQSNGTNCDDNFNGELRSQLKWLAVWVGCVAVRSSEKKNEKESHEKFAISDITESPPISFRGDVFPSLGPTRLVSESLCSLLWDPHAWCHCHRCQGWLGPPKHQGLGIFMCSHGPIFCFLSLSHLFLSVAWARTGLAPWERWKGAPLPLSPPSAARSLVDCPANMLDNVQESVKRFVPPASRLVTPESPILCVVLALSCVDAVHLRHQAPRSSAVCSIASRSCRLFYYFYFLTEAQLFDRVPTNVAGIVQSIGADLEVFSLVSFMSGQISRLGFVDHGLGFFHWSNLSIFQMFWEIRTWTHCSLVASFTWLGRFL